MKSLTIILSMFLIIANKNCLANKYEYKLPIDSSQIGFQNGILQSSFWIGEKGQNKAWKALSKQNFYDLLQNYNYQSYKEFKSGYNMLKHSIILGIPSVIVGVQGYFIVNKKESPIAIKADPYVGVTLIGIGATGIGVAFLLEKIGRKKSQRVINDYNDAKKTSIMLAPSSYGMSFSYQF